ncbi:unnamed protein product [Didymodactylos carnosus]|uniref:Uncharacterized protein n=1 Tax=Didymodactylos carnosus TaxID=1234261 RepID=A0A816A3T0_9BILA|nr:unnamed protein product [Didymodactylos carnosus]CAF1622031.1 unnamed protein product [Didymodactylos carnosus]CAF4442168.1 unnamed protein product [Didymodactylos carnosus]CAF4463360.1 unnamed protein product [Didymodactylos carnosus]
MTGSGGSPATRADQTEQAGNEGTGTNRWYHTGGFIIEPYYYTIKHLKYESYHRDNKIDSVIEFISEMIIVDTSNNCGVIITTMINTLLSFIFDISNNKSSLTIGQLMNLFAFKFIFYHLN